MKTVDCFDRRRARRVLAASMKKNSGVIVADRRTEIGKALLALELTGDVTLVSVGPDMLRSQLTVRGAVWFFLYKPCGPEIVTHEECGSECATRQRRQDLPSDLILI